MTNSIGRRRRSGYYDRLYGRRNFTLEDKLKNGVWYLQAVDPKTRKNFGRPFSRDGKTHHLLYKSFPNKFPPYKDFVAGTKRLVKSDKRNITSSFKAKDWKDLGFSTAKQGQYFIRALRLPAKTQEDIDNIKQAYANMSDNSVFKQPHKLDQYSRKLLGLFKNNLGRFNVKDTGQQFKGSHQSYELTRIGVYRDVYVYLNNVKKFILRKILQYMTSNGSCKFTFSIDILFKRHSLLTNEVKAEIRSFFSDPIIIANTGEISSKVSESISRIVEKVNKMIRSGSGWILDSIKTCHINIYKYKLHTGSSYFELPELRGKVINIQNKDNRCFLYSLLVGLHKDELNLSRTDRLKQFDKFFDMYPFDDTDMPMTTDISSKIRKYEDIVKHNINVLWWSKRDGICPFYYTDNVYEQTITLMLCHNENTNQNHFVYVPNLCRLLRSSITKHKQTLHFCLRCLGSFTSQTKLDEHTQLCKNMEITKVKMSDDESLSFNSYGKSQKVYFTFYCDFECLICDPDKHKQENHVCHHYPSGAHYICKSTLDSKPIYSFFNRGPNCVRLMIDSLKSNCQELYDKYLSKVIPCDPLTEEQEKEFYSLHKTCHICKGTTFSPTTSHPWHPVKDHCHITGKYRGVAHDQCNKLYRTPKFFPVIFHNLKGYDSHFLIKEFDLSDSDKMSCIPLNNEKFISFSMRYYDKTSGKWKTKYDIRFVDSFSFLPSSLEKLVENLSITDFKQTLLFTKSYCSWADPLQLFLLFNLIKQKGFYCYEYMNSWEKFNETCLPSLEHFISNLRYETKLFCKLSQKDQKNLINDYKHALFVFKEFKCRNLGDYHDLYLKTDVCLLADVFENFRNIYLEKFNLDPCHYYTLPGISFDACLKHTRVELELFGESQRDIYLLMEQAKIGGISGTGGKRYAKANNKYLSDYDPTKPSTFINYNDANGLYSKAQTLPLPYGEFEYTTDNINIENISLNDENCYFFMVDASIPNELHDKFNDYCPFPENISIPYDDYSSFQKQVWKLTCDKLNHSIPSDKKLIPNLLPKSNYLIHGVLLKLFVQLGCHIDKIHFIIKSKQACWNKPFIDLCMNQRNKTTNPFEKDFWKLNTNGVYGKWLENVRNHVNSEIVTTKKKFDKLVQNSSFKKSTQLNDNGLVLVERSHPTITLNKPIYVGIAILQLSKFIMYDFFYNVLRKKYPTCRLLYTDTDSFIYEVETDDFYMDLRCDAEFRCHFDLSNYKENHFMFKGLSSSEIKDIINCNKGVLGKFKDEYKGKVIKEFVGIRSKMYSLIDDSDSQKNTGKGIKKVVLNNIEHKNYKDCLFHGFDVDKMIQSNKMTFIRSKNHNVFTESSNKITLSSFDDKKFIMDNGIDQLSWGHWRINEMRKNNCFKINE